jgi:lipooligosaccharide transport system ATP-binding protein
LKESIKESVVDIKNLSKKWGDQSVLRGIDFQVQRGECFGLLGPNGAGKSTTLKILYGAVAPSAGEYFILGINGNQNKPEIKKHIGVLPQDEGLELELTLTQNLFIYGRYFGLSKKQLKTRITDLIQLFGLEPYKDHPS